MVGRKHRSRRPLSAGPQRSWLWGRNAVLEALAAERWPPNEVRCSTGLPAEVRERLQSDCARLHMPLSEHPATKLADWCGRRDHQGLIALMPPYPFVTIEAVLTSLPAAPLLLLLDQIQDPHNLGAILRCAEVFGADAVVVSAGGQCDITPHVARSSAGAVNRLAIVRELDLPALVEQLRSQYGVRALVAAGGEGRPADECDLRSGVALVIGNEGSGVDPAIRERAVAGIHIPQSGAIESLNAAVAAGVLLYEARRQRRSPAR